MDDAQLRDFKDFLDKLLPILNDCFPGRYEVTTDERVGYLNIYIRIDKETELTCVPKSEVLSLRR